MDKLERDMEKVSVGHKQGYRRDMTGYGWVHLAGQTRAEKGQRRDWDKVNQGKGTG
jgi:hypothetical protein